MAADSLFDLAVPILAHIAALALACIGILSKSNVAGFKDADKRKVPTTQFQFCSWPAYAYIILLALPATAEGVLTIALKVPTMLFSLLLWSVWLHKLKKIPTMGLFLVGFSVFMAGTLCYRSAGYLYYLSLPAHLALDSKLGEEIKHYVTEAKTRQRRIGRNLATLLAATVLELTLLIASIRSGLLLAILLTAIGTVECGVMWTLDAAVRIPPPPPESADEPAYDYLNQPSASQGLEELNQPSTGENTAVQKEKDT